MKPGDWPDPNSSTNQHGKPGDWPGNHHDINNPFPEHTNDCELRDNWKDCPCCQLLKALYEQNKNREPSKIKGKRLPSRKDKNER